MISSATFHVITTELVVGSFAMAGICFLIKALQAFNFFSTEKISQITDNTGHFALGFGLIATPFAIMTGIASSPGSDVSSPLLINKMFLSMTAAGLALSVLYARYTIGQQVWANKRSSLTQATAGLGASGMMLLTASLGGKFSRNESLFDIFNLSFDTILLMPMWATGIVLFTGLTATMLAVMGLRNRSAIQH
ncbi:MAG TPA: hypothetical protein HA354_00600 [Candidatus Poseidoniaceae archaeon]|nr:hypothetical protein [Euryarchaeota archaeon]HII36978.1 hypothetical protein [Candidatus Poseidoniaceae archaeon]